MTSNMLIDLATIGATASWMTTELDADSRPSNINIVSQLSTIGSSEEIYVLF